MKKPEAEVVAFLETAFAEFVMLMIASGMGVARPSLTIPEIEPVVLCASEREGIVTSRNASARNGISPWA